MPTDYLKLTEELAADIKTRVKSLDLKAVEKIRKADTKNGTFDVIISTEVVDRAGEVVRQAGWDLTNYKNNPIVLWGHDYYSLPIGVCTETYLTEYRGVPALGARGVFYPAEINPLAQQVRRMYEFGLKSGLNVGCTTSVGFIPREFEPDNRSIITRAELLEFSFVPVPANQGVGPAMGRAVTIDEAKELGLDVEVLRTKGLEFAEKADEAPEASEEAETDEETEEAAANEAEIEEQKAAGRASQKQLIGEIGEEHTRHTSEIEKAIDLFETAASVQPEGTDDEKAKKAADAVREGMKDLRDAMRDESNMHRAKSIANFRNFNDTDDNSFDRKPHLKTVRDAHDEYEAAVSKALDQFEAKITKTPTELDDQIDSLAEKLAELQRAHKKALTNGAKAMCKDAFGEEDKADEKVLEILSEHLAPYVPEPLQRAVFQKVGARISAATREKLGEAHQHMKAASAIVETLHGALGDDDGEESGSGGDGKTLPATAPEKKRSRSARAANTNDELDAHLFAREVLRGITTAATSGLETINRRLKK